MTALELILLNIRIIVGVFFAISGFHKLVVPSRGRALYRTFLEDNIPFPKFNRWFVPMVEFCGGVSLAFGVFFPIPVIGLLTICIVATIQDGIRRVVAMSPINKLDWIDDVLYLPETLYIVLLFQLLFLGYGAFAIGLNLFHLLERLLETFL